MTRLLRRLWDKTGLPCTSLFDTNLFVLGRQFSSRMNNQNKGKDEACLHFRTRMVIE
ncbi:unnamed protein product [Knipowitschia caucasica]